MNCSIDLSSLNHQSSMLCEQTSFDLSTSSCNNSYFSLEYDNLTQTDQFVAENLNQYCEENLDQYCEENLNEYCEENSNQYCEENSNQYCEENHESIGFSQQTDILSDLNWDIFIDQTDTISSNESFINRFDHISRFVSFENDLESKETNGSIYNEESSSINNFECWTSDCKENQEIFDENSMEFENESNVNTEDCEATHLTIDDPYDQCVYDHYEQNDELDENYNSFSENSSTHGIVSECILENKIHYTPSKISSKANSSKTYRLNQSSYSPTWSSDLDDLDDELKSIKASYSKMNHRLTKLQDQLLIQNSQFSCINSVLIYMTHHSKKLSQLVSFKKIDDIIESHKRKLLAYDNEYHMKIVIDLMDKIHNPFQEFKELERRLSTISFCTIDRHEFEEQIAENRSQIKILKNELRTLENKIETTIDHIDYIVTDVRLSLVRHCLNIMHELNELRFDNSSVITNFCQVSLKRKFQKLLVSLQ